MDFDIEKKCLRFGDDMPEEEAADELSDGKRRDLMRLRQCNFVLPEISHLNLRQMAAELNMPIYTVVRVVVFLGIYYFRRDMQNPKLHPVLREFLEEHSSLSRDRKGEVAQQ